MYIQKIENKHFDKNYPKGPFCMTRLICSFPATKYTPRKETCMIRTLLTWLYRAICRRRHRHRYSYTDIHRPTSGPVCIAGSYTYSTLQKYHNVQYDTKLVSLLVLRIPLVLIHTVPCKSNTYSTLQKYHNVQYNTKLVSLLVLRLSLVLIHTVPCKRMRMYSTVEKYVNVQYPKIIAPLLTLVIKLISNIMCPTKRVPVFRICCDLVQLEILGWTLYWLTTISNNNKMCLWMLCPCGNKIWKRYF